MQRYQNHNRASSVDNRNFNRNNNNNNRNNNHHHNSSPNYHNQYNNNGSHFNRHNNNNNNYNRNNNNNNYNRNHNHNNNYNRNNNHNNNYNRNSDYNNHYNRNNDHNNHYNINNDHNNHYNRNNDYNNRNDYDDSNDSSKPIMYHGLPMYEDKRKTANETLDIIRNGSYRIGQTNINIKNEINQCKQLTRVYFDKEDIDIRNIRSKTTLCKFEITTESTLEAAKRILEMNINDVAVLNFASATKPGGGWINGRDAQEETITRQSALYLSINQNTNANPKIKFYKLHEDLLKTNDPYKNLYTDTIIYSPKVPVIRDSIKEELLMKPFLVSFITSAATNLKLLIDDYQKNENKGSKLPNIYTNDKKPKNKNDNQTHSSLSDNNETNNPAQNLVSLNPNQPTNYPQQGNLPKSNYNQNIQGNCPNNNLQSANPNPSLQKIHVQPPTKQEDCNQPPNPRSIYNQPPNNNNNNQEPPNSQFKPSPPENKAAAKNPRLIPNAKPNQPQQTLENQKNGKGDKNDEISALKEKNRVAMYKRCEKIIKVCIANQNKAIILGAFGCGIFGNDPTEIAGIFYDILVTKKLGNYLDYVVFAMKGAKTDGYTFTAFKKKFPTY